MLLVCSARIMHAAPRTRGGACAWLSTLVSERLHATDVLDLRGRQHPGFDTDVAGERGRLQFTRKSKAGTSVADYNPFPDHARGFLYLYNPDTAHPAAAEVRFRVLPAGAEVPQDAFARGADLEVAAAAPWRIPVVAVCRSAKYAPLARLLLRDGALPRKTLSAWKTMPILPPKTQTPLLHKLEQPFAWELGSTSIHVCLADGRTLHHVAFPSPLHDWRRNTAWPAYPYTGRALCHLEHGLSARGNAVLHVHVLQALTPFVMVDATYDGYYPLPQAGALLRGPRRPLELQMRPGLAQFLRAAAAPAR